MNSKLDADKVEDSYSIKRYDDIFNLNEKYFDIKLNNDNDECNIRVETEDVNLIRTCFCIYSNDQSDKYNKIHSFIMVSNVFNLSLSTEPSIAITYEKMIVNLMHDADNLSYIKIRFCNNDSECENVIKSQLSAKDGHMQGEAVFFYSEQQESFSSFKQFEMLLQKSLNRPYVYKLDDYVNGLTPDEWVKSDFINCIQFICIFEQAFDLCADDEFSQRLHTSVMSIYSSHDELVAFNPWLRLNQNDFWSIFRNQKWDNGVGDVDFHEWQQIRLETIEKLKEIVSTMNVHHKNINISKLSGSLAGLVGGSISIIGIVAMPFTAGLSTPLIFSGLGLGLGGGAVNIGTCITEHQLMSSLCADAQELIDRDIKVSSKFAEKLNKDKLKVFQKNNEMKYLVKSLSIGTDLVTRASHDSIRFLSAGAKIVGFGLSVLSVGLDTVEVVRKTKEITEGSRNELAEKIDNVIVQLEANKDELIKNISQ